MPIVGIQPALVLECVLQFFWPDIPKLEGVELRKFETSSSFCLVLADCAITISVYESLVATLNSVKTLRIASSGVLLQREPTIHIYVCCHEHPTKSRLSVTVYANARQRGRGLRSCDLCQTGLKLRCDKGGHLWCTLWIPRFSLLRFSLHMLAMHSLIRLIRFVMGSQHTILF